MIKWIFRWAFRLLILLIVLVVAGILLLDTFAREYVEYRVRNQTGMDVKIGHLRVGLLNPQLTIENMVLYNRAEFGGAPFVEMPELHVEYDRNALASHKLRCKLVRFNLASINLVADKNGRLNADMLQAMALSSGQTTKGGKNTGQSALGIEFTGIDTLNMTLGKVTFFSMKQPSKVDQFNMNVNHQIFSNIKSEQDFRTALLAALLNNNVSLFQKGNSGQSLMQLFAPSKK